MELQGYGDKKVKKHLVLNGDDLEARNTFEDPDRVVMKELEVPADSTKVVLPKMSWNIVIYG